MAGRVARGAFLLGSTVCMCVHLTALTLEMPMTRVAVVGQVKGAKKRAKSSGDSSVAAAMVARPSYSLKPLGW